MVANLAAELVARGMEITLVTTRWQESWPGRIEYRGVSVVRLPRTGEGFLGTRRWMRNLSRFLRRDAGRYDAVYVCGLRHDSYAAMKSVDRRRVAVVLRAESSGRRGDCLWQLESGFGRQIKRRAMKADALVGASEIAHRELIAAGYPRTRVHRIVGGVPIPAKVDEEAKWAARRALESVNTLLHCPPEAPVAVYTGRLDETQGPATTIEGWRRVAQRWPNARLWLVGTHANQSDLNKRIDAAGLVGRVVIPGVFTDVVELLAAADAAIVSGDEPSSPALLLEAMAAGLPTVAADTPENRNIACERCARLFPADKFDVLGETLVTLFGDVDAANRLGEAARDCVQREYGLDQAVDAHMELLQDLVRRKGSSKKR
jgi:glycosyltransferase involved in cell wall biosynthesis